VQGAIAVQSSVPIESPKTSDAAWTAALQRVLAEPQRLRVHYQPIVDLQRGTVRGYEALARFAESPEVTPRAWFDAAARLGVSGALEAQVVQAALLSRPLLVRQRFVAVNISPAALLSSEVQAVLGSERRLEHLVVEVVDRDDGADPRVVRAAVDALRAAGARIAVDETLDAAGALDRVVGLRPDFIKINGRIVHGIEHDPTRVEMVRTLSQLATRLDAWLVAAQIESEAQLDAIIRLGVPYGQGYVLGRPAPAMSELAADIRARVRRQALPTAHVSGLTALLERAPAVTTSRRAVTEAFEGAPLLEHVVCVDSDDRPLGVVDRPAHERGGAPRPPMCLPETMTLHDAASRAMARLLESRFDPIVVVDDEGSYIGLVPLDRIVSALAR